MEVGLCEYIVMQGVAQKLTLSTVRGESFKGDKLPMDVRMKVYVRNKINKKRSASGGSREATEDQQNEAIGNGAEAVKQFQLRSSNLAAEAKRTIATPIPDVALQERESNRGRQDIKREEEEKKGISN
ncbi:uncharacterized protein LOC123202417 [Mangifera indica]|uniref:uncharacterized protein LOC123202417 n=1 Tax=Mangifera indica TaxID=29780 RepID=UPI001CF96DE1|nr:uncharacterized protein LOC123202417 [Mangifera indica]